MLTNETPVRIDTAAATVFLDGFAPQWPDSALSALLAGLETDDQRITQGSTTTPPPLMCVQQWGCEAGCAICYLGMAGGLVQARDCDAADRSVPADARWRTADSRDVYFTVGDVEEFFADACFEADRRLGEPAACRHFLNWHDDTPRDQMRAELSAWINEALRRRKEELNRCEPSHSATPTAPPW